MNPLLKKILLLSLVAAAAALLANTFLPRRIPWVRDWAYHVESEAARQKIDVIPLGTALDFHQTESHRFIDARPAEKYAKGHIPGALSLPFQTLDDHFGTAAILLDSQKPLVVYCGNRDCDDALLLTIELKNMGAAHLVLYVDGFELWSQHGGAVEK